MTASPELSVQLYTLREALAADADKTLGELAEKLAVVGRYG